MHSGGNKYGQCITCIDEPMALCLIHLFQHWGFVCRHFIIDYFRQGEQYTLSGVLHRIFHRIFHRLSFRAWIEGTFSNGQDLCDFESGRNDFIQDWICLWVLLVSGIVGVQQILNHFFTVALGFGGSGLDANLGAKSSSTDCCSCNFLLVLVELGSSIQWIRHGWCPQMKHWLYLL